MTRNPGLDLGRFIAAVIVMMGHLLFVETLIHNWSVGKTLLLPFKLGNVAVTFFFLLSGFVLAPQVIKFRNEKTKYIASRMARLYPLYFFAWLMPNLLYITFAKVNGGAILPNGKQSLILSGLASQSWTKWYLDPPNPPLWSLSAEIWLSCLFVFLVLRLESFSLIVITILLYCFWLAEASFLNPILAALPFFLTGIIFSKVQIFRKISNTRIITIINIVLIPTLIFFLTDDIYAERLSNWNSTLILLLTLLSFFFFGTISIPKFIEKFIHVISSRTYSLYAVHFPVLVFIKNQNFVTYPSNPLLYILYTLIIITVITEISYRVIERPSLLWSRRIRNSV